ncbi:hypothetical protein SAMN02910292_02876 [Lachnospiraceae bacterium XBB2008]|nr:hypothetical protein SAMN02910292_02876 [Lachnospiraceae bacterium XBB2008]
MFAAHEDDKFIGGYGHTPVVVRKADGSVTGMPEFIDEGPGEEIRTFDI